MPGPDSAFDGLHRPAPPRSDEILDRCKSAFARKGFDGASMQDLARAAGMSASNFYRYFDSKDAIIVRLVEREMEDIAARFESLYGLEHLRPVLRQTLADYLGRQKHEEDSAIWAEIQSAAPRRKAVGAALVRMEEAVQAHLLGLFGKMSGLPPGQVRDRFTAHAAMILLLVRGALMSRCAAPRRPDPALLGQMTALVMRSIDQLFDDIHAAR